MFSTEVNVNAELVADLLAATGLLPDDKLNALRGDAGEREVRERHVVRAGEHSRHHFAAQRSPRQD